MSPKNLAVLLVLAPALARAQSSPTPVVQDNSFLVEEAYNQESGIVQHIVTLRTFRGSSDYNGAFTQEWPVGSIRHQLSYDLPLVRFGHDTGIGDILVNYRYQLSGSGDTRLAIAPRFTVSLPTGDWKRGRGAGAAGIEAAVPLSFVISPLFTMHTNIDAGFTPSARNFSGARADASAFSFGQSLVFTPNQRVQPLVEVVYSREQESSGQTKLNGPTISWFRQACALRSTLRRACRLFPASPFRLDDTTSEAYSFISASNIPSRNSLPEAGYFFFDFSFSVFSFAFARSVSSFLIRSGLLSR